jgi:hypothetical protein
MKAAKTIEQACQNGPKWRNDRLTITQLRA